ncbi:MAG TPA: BlaI/MecI/CopY family transcriptional regulator [Gemmatimonadales bacterium]|jgi:predicted transcriptional regulator|nr:BlaI/MecI/CopY family transcriptional regulator [Gemmatimonadales bacterium]
MAASLTDRELDVMAVLWERGSGTVAEVKAALRDELAYTTVLTVLRILEAKGHVRHEGEGRAHRYYARIQERAARRGAVRQLLERFFSGSPELLLTELVGDRNLTVKELRRLRQVLDARAKGGRP